MAGLDSVITITTSRQPCSTHRKASRFKQQEASVRLLVIFIAIRSRDRLFAHTSGSAGQPAKPSPIAVLQSGLSPASRAYPFAPGSRNPKQKSTIAPSARHQRRPATRQLQTIPLHPEPTLAVLAFRRFSIVFLSRPELLRFLNFSSRSSRRSSAAGEHRKKGALATRRKRMATSQAAHQPRQRTALEVVLGLALVV